MSTTIVAALDDSPAAMHAARLLAGYRGERSALAVVVLNVQPRPFAFWPEPALEAGKIDDALRREGERRLGPAFALLAAAGLQLQAEVRVGVPAQSIAEEALRRGAAAIVMGTRGEGMLGGFALGSVSLRVAHRAQTPTLLVREGTSLPHALGERLRVLVPLDGSAHATRAVNALLGARAWLGAPELDLAHVRTARALWPAMSPEEREIVERWGSQQAERATRDARALAVVAQVACRVHESEGDPATEIVRFARALGSELIVMGTRGLGAVHHALIGSVALKTVHASPVPVMLVP